MQVLTQHCASLAGQMADDLLRAWISGDAVKVDAEIHRSISIAVDARDTGEQERRHLLQAVAGRMRKRADLLRAWSESPELELYAQLLGHMAIGD